VLHFTGPAKYLAKYLHPDHPHALRHIVL
jgi:hypothetical protein